MKPQNRFSALLICMAMTLFITSCNNKKKDAEPASPAGETTTSTEKVNTIVTTPQLMVLIKHTVKNYASWKTGYDAHDSARVANGLHNYVIGRGMDDSMLVLVALKADDLDKAMAFSKDPGLKAVMDKAGVTGKPEISFINTVWQDTVNVGSIPRVNTSFTVKDWNTWKKSFEEGKQERTDNGIVDRQYGHEAGDNHKVSLVTALTDPEKAKAYWASDVLKKRREAAGLTTEPKRFIFNIVQRYR